jgi:glycosyltransferase involved in cell wall biosynthesis
VDIVAHTSVAPEPFGRVIVEGMLAGKPVVATRAGGACEIIEDGITGRLVTPGNADVLAGVFRDLLEDQESAQRLAGAGYAAAVERFSVPAMLRGIEEEIAAATRL